MGSTRVCHKSRVLKDSRCYFLKWFWKRDHAKKKSIKSHMLKIKKGLKWNISLGSLSWLNGWLILTGLILIRVKFEKESFLWVHSLCSLLILTQTLLKPSPSPSYMMRCDFVSWIEGGQMCPTPCLRAYMSEETTLLRMVTGVVPATTSPTLKLEQRSIIYQDKGWQ